MTAKYETDNNRDRNRTDAERYDAIAVDSGTVVVYDTHNEQAWIESDAAVDLDAIV